MWSTAGFTLIQQHAEQLEYLLKQVQDNFPIESICLILQGKMIGD